MFPTLLKIGPITLHSFGLLVILGFMAGIFLAARLARERGLSGEAFLDAAVVMLFSAIAGARLLFVLLNWTHYSAHPLQALSLWEGGMSFHGGIAAGVLSGIWCMRRRSIALLPMADAAAPALAVGYAIGRVGCLLNGCCHGGPTDLPWAISGAYCKDGAPGLSYHPAQAYAALITLGLAAGLLYAYRRPHRSGQVMALYAAGYSIYRFAIEGVRAGITADVVLLGLTEAQLFSVLSLAAALAWWAWLSRRSKPAPELAPGVAPVGSAA